MPFVVCPVAPCNSETLAGNRLFLDTPLNTLGALSLSKRLGTRTHSTLLRVILSLPAVSLSNGQAGCYSSHETVSEVASVAIVRLHGSGRRTAARTGP
jgi:hypothetical protein